MKTFMFKILMVITVGLTMYVSVLVLDKNNTINAEDIDRMKKSAIVPLYF